MSRRRWWRPRLRSRLTLVLLGTLVSLAVLEVGLRLRYPVLNRRRHYRPGLWVADEVRSFKNRPDYRGRYRNYESEATVRVNHLGVRGREITEADLARPLRILCVGDSCTFGLGVGDEDTYPAVLEQSLRDRGIDAVVWNGGVPAYGTRQADFTLAALSEQLRPNLVILFWLRNDIPSRVSKTLIESHQVVDGYLVEDQADYERYRAKELDPRWVDHCWIYKFFQVRWKVTMHREKAPALAEQVGDERVPPRLLDHAVTLVRGIERRATDLGARFLVGIHATRLEVLAGRALPSVEEFQRRCQEAGIQTVALLPAFQEATERDGRLYVERDHIHLNAAGNRVVAESLLGPVQEAWTRMQER